MMRIERRFFQYVAPSVLAFALSGVYAIVDGYFVGNSLGDLGLAAINLAYPITALLQALGTGIGLAGSIRFTILGAQGKRQGEKETFTGSLLLLGLVSLLATAGLFLASTPLLRLLGAGGALLAPALSYIQVIVLGAAFQIFATGLVPFIRNLGGATFAMVAMILGFGTNIVLDYLFVWAYGWGMAGAALATVIGQGLTLLCAVAYLFYKKPGLTALPLRKMREVFGAVLALSLSPFGLTFSPNITLVLMNRFLVNNGGDDALAIYACIAYITCIAYLLLQGVGDGCQPLMSHYYGEKAAAPLQKVFRLSYLTGAAMAVFCMALLFFTKGGIGRLFGASAEVSAGVAQFLPLFLGSLLFLAFVRITTAQLYATEKTRLSYLLVYAEPLLLFILLLVLPGVLGIWGMWAAVPLAQTATAGIAIWARRRAFTKNASKPMDTKPK